MNGRLIHSVCVCIQPLFVFLIQSVMDEYIHGCIHGEHIVSKQINAVTSVYSLSPEGHQSAMESLPRPNQ